MHSVDAIAAALTGDRDLCSDAVHLVIGDVHFTLRSNDMILLQRLGDYLGRAGARVVAEESSDAIEIILIEREVPDLQLDFIDWAREPGKSGRKDSYVDIDEGRVIRKVRTGMVFLQSQHYRIAAGPCLQYDNQVINFINNQYMNLLQNRGALICHAAAIAREGKALAMAGFSGGGKSTLMLGLLEQPGSAYITNDRLFLQQVSGQVIALGIPKLPRVNPGTIVHNARLHHLISADKRRALLALPSEQLWSLEEKYDVDIEQCYGPDSIVDQVPLEYFLVLNWRRDSDERLSVAEVDLQARPELLTAIMKSSGPFYQYPDGSFYRDNTAFDSNAYLERLAGITVFEASGGVNFKALSDICRSELLS